VVKQPDGIVRPVPPNAKVVPVARGEYVVARTAERATEVSSPTSGKGFQLPVTLATVTPSGTSALEIIVRTGNRLRPRGSATDYEGRILVGLVNKSDPGITIPLPAPVQVTVAGPIDSITPDQPKFEATNTFVPVTLTARNPRDPVELHVSTGIDLTET